MRAGRRRLSFRERVQRATDALLGSTPQVGGVYSTSYKGARIHRGNSDWPTATRSVRQEVQPSIRALRARARDISKNSASGPAYLELLVSSVVGPYGFKVIPSVRDTQGELLKDINDKIAEAWKRWSEEPVTVDRKLDLAGALALIQETEATDGELLVDMVTGAPGPFGFALNLIDSDLLDERFEQLPDGRGRPEIRMSVEIANGAPEAYHVLQEPIAYWGYGARGIASRDRTRIRAWNCHTRRGTALHPHVMKRLNQARGITWFHAVIERIDNLDSYSEATIYAARLGATSSVLIKPNPDEEIGENEEQPTAISQIEATTGGAFKLRPGDDAIFWEPKHPTDQFPGFWKVMARETAMALPGAMYWAIAGDLESTSFSSMRGGENVAKPVWRGLQRRAISTLVKPIYDAWLNAAILSGQLRLPSVDPTRYRAARFRGRGFPYVNPIDEIRAYALAIQAGLMSREEIIAEVTSGDYDEVFEQLAKEKELADFLEINVDPPQGTESLIAIAEAQKTKSGSQSDGGTMDGQSDGDKSLADVPARIRRRLVRSPEPQLNGGNR